MLSLKAPAKVNLKLKVLGRRADGYHELDMIMVPLDLADEIILAPQPSGIVIDSDSPEVPKDNTNSLWKAAEVLQKVSGKNFGIKIFLKKKIPVAAGLGGGSSDAAAVLKGGNELLQLGLSEEKLSELGLKIGADVPFFLKQGAQRAQGIGEILSSVSVPLLHLILINPGFPVSTPEVYRWYDQCHPEQSEGSPVQLFEGDSFATLRMTNHSSQLTSQKLDGTPVTLENDLERVVLPRYPVLVEIKKKLIDAGALGTLMSGSGGTVFGLFGSTESRDQGYDKILSLKDSRWWICKAASI